MPRVMVLAPGAVSAPAAQGVTLSVASVGVNARALGELFDGPAELPRSEPDTTYPDTTGWSVTTVNAGGNLQTAINNATYPAIIEVEAGATFTGNFTLPSKSNWEAGEWIIIRSTAHASLPAAGTRVAPSNAANMPKLTNSNSDPILYANDGSHHYWIHGIEFEPGTTLQYYGIQVGGYGFSTFPHHYRFDRCYVHGNDSGTDHRRGFGLNGDDCAVFDSYVSEWHSSGSDSQAVWSFNSHGPLLVQNCYLSASGENFFTGGTDPSSEDTIPRDVTVRGCHIHKEARWYTNDPFNTSIKNLLELKVGIRVLIEDCVLENCWVDAQTGWGVIIKSENQDGGPQTWSRSTDITFRYCIIRNVSSAFNLGANVAATTGPTRISVHDNLFEYVGGASPYGGSGYNFGDYFHSSCGDIELAHNTCIYRSDAQSGSRYGHSASAGIGASELTIRDNLQCRSAWGIFFDAQAEGLAGWTDQFGGAVPERCIWAGRNSSLYPNSTDNFFPSANEDIGFENWVGGGGGDYRLASDSPYKGAGTDGKDVGCDVATLNTRIAGVVQVYEGQ